jgi:hypothetical protein
MATRMTARRGNGRKVAGDSQICLVTGCTVKAISLHLSFYDQAPSRFLIAAYFSLHWL